MFNIKIKDLVSHFFLLKELFFVEVQEDIQFTFHKIKLFGIFFIFCIISYLSFLSILIALLLRISSNYLQTFIFCGIILFFIHFCIALLLWIRIKNLGKKKILQETLSEIEKTIKCIKEKK